MDKSRKALATLKDTVRVETWMTPSISLELLDTGVCSIMTYAIGIWGPNHLRRRADEDRSKHKKGIRELSVLYNSGLRQILQVPMNTPLTIIYILAKRTPFEVTARKICWRFAKYIQHTRDMDQDQPGGDRVITEILKTPLNMDWREELR